MSLLDRCGPSGRGSEQLDESPFCQRLAASLWMEEDNYPPRRQHYERMGARVLDSSYFRPLFRELYEMASSLTFERAALRAALGQGAPRYSESCGKPYFSRFDEPRHRGNPCMMGGGNYYGPSEESGRSYYGRRDNPSAIDTRDYSLSFTPTQDDLDRYFYADGQQSLRQQPVKQEDISAAGKEPPIVEPDSGKRIPPTETTEEVDGSKDTDPLSGLETADFDPAGIEPVSYSPGDTKSIGSRPRSSDGTGETDKMTDGADGPIPWHHDTLDAYKEALKANKPLVVVFGEQGSSWFVDQMAEMRKPEMEEVAQQAVWLEGIPSKDKAAAAIAKALELKEYPTISVLAPNPDKITETMRFEGFFPINELRAPLQKAIYQVPVQRQSTGRTLLT